MISEEQISRALTHQAISFLPFPLEKCVFLDYTAQDISQVSPHPFSYKVGKNNKNWPRRAVMRAYQGVNGEKNRGAAQLETGKNSMMRHGTVKTHILSF